ncbi:hydrogenase maturation nickel metallochaperone HypA [Vibrio sp. V27_P1S3P104]|uniref:hydrogenase maturation nickel metallochaperone HypA n=1 Tax=Vibrio TaxID=662 RepID=UPI000C165CF0|nr:MULTISPECIES: hydrogenase maturation nickel metallochaperone HypA [Vibrio]NAW69518.1 hydrogenase maturation nickel metallochaperone HypA [Vibrio sp. V28_P6S34P95]NAX04476.1 hydrogenase maturation nickel metallochaperone HypA [Vibrio sp. V30_P3S12P165]NAX33159.1 hydrogenase maturation nickel metallochaperone HypA [Vibrio sp. V29_P1S30P107]NAX38183.1 hydrogenase maturation nickel metallochaperone HypA [Vibrio sp. V27_P1S3P104]NAX40915.1 hydrogenase maturation nickel metallochaperone HypA [Vib
MHELSISLKTIDLVVEQAQKHRYRKVTKITLSVGVLSCIESEALRTGLEMASRETIAQDAEVVIETLPAIAVCQGCHYSFTIQNYQDSCPQCHSYQLTVQQGEELQIKNIEVE